MSEEMDYDKLHATYVALKSKHVAANNANEELSERVNKLLAENAYLKGQLANAETNLAIQKTIVASTIMGSSERQNRDYGEISKLTDRIRILESELKELKGV